MPSSPKKGRSAPNGKSKPIEIADDSDSDAGAGTRTGVRDKFVDAVDSVASDDEDEGLDEGEEEYEIEAIRDHRGRPNGSIEYLIKWKGYPESDNTWEPEDNARNSSEIIDAYWKKVPTKSQPRKFATLDKKRKVSKRSRAVAGSNDEDEEDDDEEVEPMEVDPLPKRRKSAVAVASSSRSRSPASASASASPSKSRRPVKKSVSPVRVPLSDSDSESDSQDDEEAERERINALSVAFLERAKGHESWETIVKTIETMERGEDEVLMAQLRFDGDKEWNRGVRAIGRAGEDPCIWVQGGLARRKCPQKMLNFYEEHLRFSRPPSKSE